MKKLKKIRNSKNKFQSDRKYKAVIKFDKFKGTMDT